MPLFTLAHLPYWLLLGLGVLLFLAVIVVGGGDDDLDLDPDDGIVDLDAEGEAEGDRLQALQLLGWLGFGRAPLMMMLATDFSLWGLLGWMLNVFLAGALGGLLGNLASGAVLLGSLLLALLLGRQLARPLGRLFAAFGEDAGGDRLVGCLGTVSTSLIPPVRAGKIGQVDVLDPARNLVTVNAVLPDWATVAPQRGERVLVIERSGSSYLVVAKDSVDYDTWFNQRRA